jgi:hypothetical protein
LFNFSVQNKVFCFPCRLASKCPIHPNTSTLNPAYKIFIAGCCEWKNALSKFKIHEKSKISLGLIYVVNQQEKLGLREQLTLATQ